MPRVLVACEESQVVTAAFRSCGIETYSCDVLPCSGGHPEWHLQQDATPLLEEAWDLVLAFPPCTHLSRSGGRWFAEKRADGRQASALEFFSKCVNSNAPRIAIENPIGIVSTAWRKPDQIIQPWQFGHGETKATCLWLKGLPALQQTCIVSGRVPRPWWLPPSVDRARLRSITCTGVARAMADQWGRLL